MKNKFDKASESIATRAILIVILLLVTSICLVLHAQPKTGYLVCSSGIGGVKCKKVISIEVVQEIVKLKYPEVTINIENQLKYSNYIQILTENSGIYIEKKRIVRKNGKVKYKKIKK